jgi:hypothetical protein
VNLVYCDGYVRCPTGPSRCVLGVHWTSCVHKRLRAARMPRTVPLLPHASGWGPRKPAELSRVKPRSFHQTTSRSPSTCCRCSQGASYARVPYDQDVSSANIQCICCGALRGHRTSCPECARSLRHCADLSVSAARRHVATESAKFIILSH